MIGRLGVIGVLLSSGCLLEQNRPETHLGAITVIAVESDPPEALPGARVRLRAVLASPNGPVQADDLRWSLCRTPRALDENGAVAADCATHEELPLAEHGLELELALPADGCARFGPETAAGLRPSDADASGGYYQPLRVSAPGARVSVQRLRLRCALANAPIEIAQAYAARYRDNVAPAHDGIALAVAGPVLPETTRELRLKLAPDTRERYLRYDREHTRLVEQRETLHVSWYASAGALAESETRADESEARVGWTAPSQAGTAWVWAVLRDDRGGMTSALLAIEVEAAK